MPFEDDHRLEAIPFLLYTTTSPLMTLGNGSGILKGQFRFSSSATLSYLMKNLECIHLSKMVHWSRGETAREPTERERGREGERERGGERTRREAATTIAAPSPLLIQKPGPRERGPAAGSRNNTRQAESHRIGFLLLGRLLLGTGLPCSCHLSCYRTSVTRHRRCPCAEPRLIYKH